MIESSRPYIQIDLNEFKLHLHLKNRTQLTLHFNSPSRKFYLSLIALVVNEMKKAGKIKSINLQEYGDLLALLNETIGGAAGSSEKDSLLHRICRKWKDALPNLEEAPLFKVLGRKRVEGEGAVGRIYSFTDAEKDGWANLFEYMGSEENVRLRFAIDKIGVGLNEVSIIYADSLNGDAWDRFISNLQKEEPDLVEEAAVSEPKPISSLQPQKPKISWLTKYRWVMLVVVIGIAAVAIWKIYLSPVRITIASVDRMKYSLPDRPSIAVLPFVNMSEDPKQEFLCDGMTEEIITALTKVPRLFVIARNSTFTYKGKAVKVSQVSEDLGVRYVLEGSLRRSDDRIRITVQLIDAIKGEHLWAERYDRDLKDIFSLQDEITLKILTSVQSKLSGGDVFRAVKYAEKYYSGKQGLDCYLKLMEASGHRLRGTIEGNMLARRMAEEAIALCPDNPGAYVTLGWVYHHDYYLRNTRSPRETLERGAELARKALSMDDSLSSAHTLLCHIYDRLREHDKAVAEGARAVALDPAGISALNAYAISLGNVGKYEEAILLFQKAIRISPFGEYFLYRDFGFALRKAGRLEEAVSELKKAMQFVPDDVVVHLGLAITYTLMGRDKEARSEATEVLRINPKFSVADWAERTIYKDSSEREKDINTMRKAGLK